MVAVVPTRRRGGLVVAITVIGCAAVCVLALGLGSGSLLEGKGRVELLCSDGRCGEGSKLTRQNAVKDLDRWADKAELKDRLDELQTVMERGMTHKSAAKQLDSYFDKLDRQVQTQKMHALRQEQSEGFAPPVLSSKPHTVTASLHSAHVEGSKQEEHSQDREAARHEDAASSRESSHADNASGKHKHNGISASAATLNRYFDDQARKIKEENQKQLRSSKLSASQAEADLDKYFDSLASTTKHSKIHTVVKKLDKLDHEVHELRKPVVDLKGDAERTNNEVQALKDENKRILALDKQEHEETEQAEKQAAQAKSSVVVVQAKSNDNPKIKMYGLPPDWEAYKDQNTKYAYFYNDKTGKSTWDSPKGAQVELKGLPSGWESFTDNDGKVYYVQRGTGLSTYEDPRIAPGASVLKLMQSVRKARDARQEEGEKKARLAALSADHGVYGHNYPRSQWADKGWMKFLTSSNAKGTGSMLTNAQELRDGMEGSGHAVVRPAASRNY